MKHLALIAVLLFGFSFLNGAPLKKKVLIVMLDGLRADAVENFQLPTLLKLKNGTWKPGYKGAWTDSARTILDTVAHSAPNHAAIAAGVTAAKHKVFRNGDTPKGNWKEWPSWLHRLVKAQPDKKVFFVYAWGESGKIDPTPLVPRGFGSDWVNAVSIPAKLINEKTCPDALMYYINSPDGGGHGSGFYPYGNYYAPASFLADKYLGQTLEAIARRKEFADEDWLILVTADHGGYSTGHGQPGGQSDTVPLIVAGRNIPAGRIAGTPSVADLPVTALEFLGIDTSKIDLDGKVITSARTVETPRKIADDLALHMIFSRRGLPVNRGGAAVKCLQEGTGVASSGRRYLLFDTVLNASDVKTKEGKFAPQGLIFSGTEKFKAGKGRLFTLTFWLRLPEKQPGDSVVIGNKLQTEADKPGFFIAAARQTWPRSKARGLVLNFKDSAGKKAFDMGTFDTEPGRWTFYAVTVTPDDALRFYQGRNDGYLYFFVEKCPGTLNNGKPLYVSQPAGGGNSANLEGCMDDLAVWNRCLTANEIKAIFEAGRRGRSLMDLK